MEFRFDATQQFQLDAIASVLGRLDGQGHIGAPLIPAAGTTVVPNRLDLDDSQLLDNLHTVQAERGLPQDDALACIEQNVELALRLECTVYDGCYLGLAILADCQLVTGDRRLETLASGTLRRHVLPLASLPS